MKRKLVLLVSMAGAGLIAPSPSNAVQPSPVALFAGPTCDECFDEAFNTCGGQGYNVATCNDEYGGYCYYTCSPGIPPPPPDNVVCEYC
jgi:hypothetical protein